MNKLLLFVLSFLLIDENIYSALLECPTKLQNSINQINELQTEITNCKYQSSSLKQNYDSLLFQTTNLQQNYYNLQKDCKQLNDKLKMVQDYCLLTCQAQNKQYSGTFKFDNESTSGCICK